MMRTKAKSLLLGFVLIMSCLVFFACKEKTSIRVESIGFTEQSISMLVGEEYTPDIKILPSYATSRSYTLISSDNSALKINGGSIVALKPSLDVKLKVVSNDSENINDVISVSIYEEASELDAPTELTFDGYKFTFLGKDNANSYMLNIDGQEINIGNNTEYMFSDVVGRISEPYNTIHSCKVKALGDGKIFKHSTYSEEIKFVKVSNVVDFGVENEVLNFKGIENISEYTVEVLKDNKLYDTKTVINNNFDSSKITLNIADLTDSVNGAEYVLRITPNILSYNAQSGVDVFGGKSVDIAYNVLGVVKDLTINNNVISWGFVKNAQNYTIELYKDGNLLNTYSDVIENTLKITYEDAGEYVCKVIANSTKINTTSGKIYSDELKFHILPAPEIVTANNKVEWTDIEDAEGYLVTIKDSTGSIITNKEFVIYPTYDVSGFNAGDYNIQVIACGNTINNVQEATLSSRASEIASWTVLKGLKITVEDQKLCIQDSDLKSLNKYNVIFDNVNIILNKEDLEFDATTNTFIYDLKGYTFTPGTHSISVQSVGEGSIFDAGINSTNIFKLSNSSILGLSNLKFTIQQASNASRYEIKIYKSNDTQNTIKVLDNIVNNNQFVLDGSSLSAGTYIAKVFCYGNGANVFDADNSDEGTTINFEKLAIPTITVDAENLKLTVDATKCNLFENSINTNISGNEYSLNLSAGDYTYTAQALGDNLTILDSDITSAENVVKIKKLATPTVTFNKTSLSYTINSVDQTSISELKYLFTLNGQEVIVANNKADCKDLIKQVGTYKIKAYTTIEAVAGFNLVINSNIQTEIEGGYNEVVKLNGLCNFKISNGSLIVEPNESLSGVGYNLTLRIDNGENDIVLNDFTYTNSRFETNIYDNKYNIRDELLDIINNAGEYSVFTIISQNKDNVVTSEEIQCVNTIKTLGKVNTIGKNGQTIEFNSVSNATNYIAVVKVNNVEYYVDLAGKYAAGATNVLEIANLIALMESKGIEYKEKEPYTISIIALNEDIYTLPSKGVASYTFEFLKTPEISIVEKDGENTKYLNIANNDEQVLNYYIQISQGEFSKNITLAKQSGDSTLINMDEIGQLVAGNIQVKVKSLVDSGDYFESKDSLINVIKLRSSTITIENGILVWDEINGAKQYNLTYSNTNESGVKVLTEGADNFIIQDGKCYYNFDSLQAGKSRMYLQVDSQVKVGDTYYLNSNNGDIFENVYKLSTPIISVNKGQIKVELKSDEISDEYLKNIEVKVNDVVKNINILNVTEDTDDVVISTSGNTTTILIAPDVLLSYGSTELLKETLTLKLNSNGTTVLNSSIGAKDIYGLLSPTSLDITTSTKTQSSTDGKNVIEEVFEKITWNNPSANQNYVNEYEIVINYNGQDYPFTSTERIFMMPAYNDKDGDGVKDDDEIEFGAGVYTIKVKALTNDSTQYVDSKYCEAITVTILETPTNISVKDGNIIWQNDSNVGYYLIKVYLIEKDQDTSEDKYTLLDSSNVNLNEFDLTKLAPFKTGVYGVSLKAMHDASRVLSSKESEMLQVVRLPQVESYFVRNGELHIRMHKFYSSAKIYLTEYGKSNGVSYELPLINSSADQYVKDYITSGAFTTWSASDIINTYSDDNYFIDVKYQLEGDPTLSVLSQQYNISVKLFGNTIGGTNIGAIVSGYPSELAINSYFEDDEIIEDKNLIEKLPTPIINVSETERGVVLMSGPKGVTYSLNYYINKENLTSLQGVQLYEVNISTSDKYTLYVAEIVNKTKLLESLSAVGSELITDAAENNYLKHFIYNDITFNVIDAIEENEQSYIPFDFNVNTYYYYDKDGKYRKDMDLTAGGSFVISARFLGDDSMFVQSNVSDIVTIKRYNVLNLSVNNGKLSWINQATAEDHPIYIISLTNSTENYNLVLYNPSIHPSEDELRKCLDSSKTYIFDTISYVFNDNTKDEVIVYSGLADAIDRARAKSSSLSKLIGLGGTFVSTIKAHYTDATEMNVVLAQDGDGKTVTILPQSNISVVSGDLSWNLSTISSGTQYIENYLLQVFEGETLRYSITLEDGDYSLLNNIATYKLPPAINNGSDGEFKFAQNSNYIFKLTALGVENSTYVNSVATTTGEITILPDLKDVKMVNGKLTWTNTTPYSVEVCVTYMEGDATRTIINLETDNDFELPTSDVDIKGTKRALIAGYDYSIKVRLKGQSSALSGFFSDEVTVKRLPTISSSSIVANSSGVLTWEKDNAEGVKYRVVYTTEDENTYETALLDTNSFDFAGVASGKIKVKVFAHHNDYFTSFASNMNEQAEEVDEKLVKVLKLGVPSNIKYLEGTSTIVWDKVKYANGDTVKTVEDYMVRIKENGKVIGTYTCTTNQWKIVGVSSNAFEIAVKAINAFDENTNENKLGKYIINGEYSVDYSMGLPNQVDVSTFKFREDLQAFEWKAIDGEQPNDIYRIGFNYIGSSTIEAEKEILAREIDGVTYYYYYPKAMGTYTNIYVQVIRAGSLASQETWWKGSSENSFTFDLFSSGDGSKDSPYIITGERHLRNITYFLGAYYRIDESFGLTSSEPITNSNQIFTGSINGNNKEISATNITYSNEKNLFDSNGYVGLFNKVNGAVFENITLANFTISGYVNSSNLYLGVLVGYASNSAFNNVKVVNSSIAPTKSTSIGYTYPRAKIYVGAIAGYADNCQFNYCVINLDSTNTSAKIVANITGDSNTVVAIGGVAGYANNCTLTNNSSNNRDTSTDTSYMFIASVTASINVNIYIEALIGESGEDSNTVTQDEGYWCKYLQVKAN